MIVLIKPSKPSKLRGSAALHLEKSQNPHISPKNSRCLRSNVLQSRVHDYFCRHFRYVAYYCALHAFCAPRKLYC